MEHKYVEQAMFLIYLFVCVQAWNNPVTTWLPDTNGKFVLCAYYESRDVHINI
jgi:hypothetical protein